MTSIVFVLSSFNNKFTPTEYMLYTYRYIVLVFKIICLFSKLFYKCFRCAARIREFLLSQPANSLKVDRIFCPQYVVINVYTREHTRSFHRIVVESVPPTLFCVHNNKSIFYKLNRRKNNKLLHSANELLYCVLFFFFFFSLSFNVFPGEQCIVLDYAAVNAINEYIIFY